MSSTTSDASPSLFSRRKLPAFPRRLSIGRSSRSTNADSSPTTPSLLSPRSPLSFSRSPTVGYAYESMTACTSPPIIQRGTLATESSRATPTRTRSGSTGLETEDRAERDAASTSPEEESCTPSSEETEREAKRKAFLKKQVEEALATVDKNQYLGIHPSERGIPEADEEC
ncbi:hypothetical protein L198_04780 [Cryptococcus wingfieldii CBS 7118]|uniref:Uncharacterized protein n=1 Tax=Cryptococcus wingfieldii CBS 7118 TaxID=1295528 RepID=A0A1E3J174_9TREE|nr:hypothetical protein L198_04780 [Cryptococcus wingfieldii CBS 7118]ODN94640.1 hypothetical protein L198_04780 [Cryptococcus wingfieldii CBS 7118]